mmetsp:Transcript_1839/g.5819  ORF Transcript_1839/g.5819 Transcript_1839/m.5819 type:complete len:218 (-) Transcript_1839:201-854(-)
MSSSTSPALCWSSSSSSPTEPLPSGTHPIAHSPIVTHCPSCPSNMHASISIKPSHLSTAAGGGHAVAHCSTGQLPTKPHVSPGSSPHTSPTSMPWQAFTSSSSQSDGSSSAISVAHMSPVYPATHVHTATSPSPTAHAPSCSHGFGSHGSTPLPLPLLPLPLSPLPLPLLSALSQRSPLKPSGQSHTTSPESDAHVPPCWQGFSGSHWSTYWQVSPT